MAVSNAIGSNVFDINLGMGLPFLISICIQRGRPFNLLSHDEQVLAWFPASPIFVLPFAFSVIREAESEKSENPIVTGNGTRASSCHFYNGAITTTHHR